MDITEQDLSLKSKDYGTVRRVVNSKTGTVYWLVGTNHISKISQEQVKRVFDIIKPDCIAVEHCREVFGYKSRMLNIPFTIPSNFFYLSFLHTPPSPKAKLNIWWKVGQILETLPAGEFHVSVEEASQRKIPLALVDMKASQVLLRKNNNRYLLEPGHCGKMLEMFLNYVSKRNPSDIIPSVKVELQNLLERKCNESRHVHPFNKLLEDRDQFMASYLRQLCGSYKTVVGVFGENHIEGIARHLNDHKEDEKSFRKTLKEKDPKPFHHSAITSK